MMNEPYGYGATDLTNAEAAWVARYPSVPRGRMILPGLWSDQNLCAVGADSRLTGTLLSLHIYVNSFINWNFGLGSAMSVLLLIFLFIVSLIYLGIFQVRGEAE